jgi:hypothetical protein
VAGICATEGYCEEDLIIQENDYVTSVWMRKQNSMMRKTSLLVFSLSDASSTNENTKRDVFLIIEFCFLIHTEVT